MCALRTIQSSLGESSEQHSAMVLKLDDVAEFRANFKDKATNIRAIAEALNLGFDAFVFIDDSPVECATSVRHCLKCGRLN